MHTTPPIFFLLLVLLFYVSLMCNSDLVSAAGSRRGNTPHGRPSAQPTDPAATRSVHGTCPPAQNAAQLVHAGASEPDAKVLRQQVLQVRLRLDVHLLHRAAVENAEAVVGDCLAALQARGQGGPGRGCLPGSPAAAPACTPCLNRPAQPPLAVRMGLPGLLAIQEHAAHVRAVCGRRAPPRVQW